MSKITTKNLNALSLIFLFFVSQPAFSSFYCSNSFDRTEKVSIENVFSKSLTIDDNASAQILKLKDNNISISLNVYGEKEKITGNLDIDKMLYVELFGRSVICWKERDEQESEALVIVDMQPSFLGREKNKKVVNALNENILDAIELAKRNGVYIIFIEFKGYGQTIDTLRDSVSDYKKVRYFIKTTDGMLEKANISKDEILSFLIYHQINSLAFAGVNGGACVFASILDGLRYFKNVYAYNTGIADFTLKNAQVNYSYGDLFNEIRFADPKRVGSFTDLNGLDDLKMIWE